MVWDFGNVRDLQLAGDWLDTVLLEDEFVSGLAATHATLVNGLASLLQKKRKNAILET